MRLEKITFNLLKIFKKMNKNDIFYTIMQIINGTYIFESDKMNNVPYPEIVVGLEKLIVTGTNCKEDPKDLAESLELVWDFTNHVHQMSYSEVESNKLLNLKYLLLYKKAQYTNKKSIQFLRARIAGIIFALTMSSYISADLIEKNSTNKISNTNNIEYNVIDCEKSINKYDIVKNNALKVSTSLKEAEELYDNELIIEENNNSVIDNEEHLQYIRDTLVITNQEKVDNILEEYNLSYKEFNVIAAICMAEAKYGSYEDAYSVINTMYNRLNSEMWVNYVSEFYGNDAGHNLYYHAILNGQFVAYQDGRYKEFLGVTNTDTYQAVIDFLTTKRLRHDFLQFRSYDTELDIPYKQYEEYGNKFFDSMLDDEFIVEQGMSR